MDDETVYFASLRPKDDHTGLSIWIADSFPGGQGRKVIERLRSLPTHLDDADPSWGGAPGRG